MKARIVEYTKFQPEYGSKNANQAMYLMFNCSKCDFPLDNEVTVLFKTDRIVIRNIDIDDKRTSKITSNSTNTCRLSLPFNYNMIGEYDVEIYVDSLELFKIN